MLSGFQSEEDTAELQRRTNTELNSQGRLQYREQVQPLRMASFDPAVTPFKRCHSLTLSEREGCVSVEKLKSGISERLHQCNQLHLAEAQQGAAASGAAAKGVFFRKDQTPSYLFYNPNDPHGSGATATPTSKRLKGELLRGWKPRFKKSSIDIWSGETRETKHSVKTGISVWIVQPIPLEAQLLQYPTESGVVGRIASDPNLTDSLAYIVIQGNPKVKHPKLHEVFFGVVQPVGVMDPPPPPPEYPPPADLHARVKNQHAGSLNCPYFHDWTDQNDTLLLDGFIDGCKHGGGKTLAPPSAFQVPINEFEKLSVSSRSTRNSHGKLVKFCEANTFSGPVFPPPGEYPLQNGVVACPVRVTRGKKYWNERGEGTTRQMAREEACKRLLERLRREVAVENHVLGILRLPRVLGVGISANDIRAHEFEDNEKGENPFLTKGEVNRALYRLEEEARVERRPQRLGTSKPMWGINLVTSQPKSTSLPLV